MTWGTALTLVLGTPAGPVDITDATVGTERPFNAIWWTFTPTVTGTVAFDTSMTIANDPTQADTVMQLYTGGDTTRVMVASNDDASGGGTLLSRFTYVVQAGVAYHLVVGTYDAGGDTITAYIVDTTVPTPVDFSDLYLLDPAYDGTYGDIYVTGCKIAEDVGLFLWASFESIIYHARAVRWTTTGGTPSITRGPSVDGPLEHDLPTPITGPYDEFSNSNGLELAHAYQLSNGWAAVFFARPNYRQPAFGQLVHVDPTTLVVTFGDLITDPTSTYCPFGSAQPAALGQDRVLFAGLARDAAFITYQNTLSFDLTTNPPTWDMVFTPRSSLSWADTSTGPFFFWADLGTQWLFAYFTPGLSNVVFATVPDSDGHPNLSVTPTVRLTIAASESWYHTFASPLMGNKVHIWRGGENQFDAGTIHTFDISTWAHTATDILLSDLVSSGGIYKGDTGGMEAGQSWLPVGDGTNLIMAWVGTSNTGGYTALFDGSARSPKATILSNEGGRYSQIRNWEAIPVSTTGHLVAVTTLNDNEAHRDSVGYLIAAQAFHEDTVPSGDTDSGEGGLKLMELTRGRFW